MTMNDREKAIYDGLKTIGVEISTFFFDAVSMYESNIGSKPYLLAHLSREIESGIRDILTVVTNEDDEICPTCKRPLNRKISHKESIIKAMGLDTETEFIKKWHKTANLFNKYAHRHGAWKSPREKDEFDKLWIDFEDILEKLVGNYYSIADRLDSLLKVVEPTDQIIGTLPNLLDNESRYSYFFQKLESSKWLIPLYENGYFDPTKNPAPREVENKSGHFWFPRWWVLEYLEKVSEGNFRKPDAKTSETILKIVNNIINYKNKRGERIQNYISDYYLFKR